MSSAILDMHYCLAPNERTDADLLENFDAKQLASITKMSGIHNRRVVPPGVTASDLAFVAAQRLFARGKFQREDIDLLIFASQTPDYQIPATACDLHGRLGLKQECGAFDINLGCSAFPYCLAVAHSMLTAGLAKTALLCNADAVSTVVHPKDRGLVPLHGDGAAVCILQRIEGEEGIEGCLMGTDGKSSRKIVIPASGMRQPRSPATQTEETDSSGSVRTPEQLCMNGPAVFHFSLKTIPTAIESYLSQHDWTLDEIDLVLLHQANKTMVDLIYRALKVPEDKRFYFMEQIGNLAGASTPILLNEAWRQERLKPGQRVLLASFGNGLSWSVTSLVWSSALGKAPEDSVEFDPTLLSAQDA
ncbi:3-oxoacyl-ACP synthase III family protein [Puniceicoccus vermicola]|uniref:Ketoacyl-ACP synthase III n=1 Tax=Puniceicoccus vermicola TaxID=388746 RepID=A0A7X1AYE5_9BACT|nr:ketoacyl-ACP synthase III [Puniceicoccus vermicola]MBC2601213.1 ketoacyl-ACP synthase III [Puniceicoccus vermicola]